MKKITLLFLLITIVGSSSLLFAQEKTKNQKLFNQELTLDNQRSIEETGFIRCGSTEYERALQAKYPNRASSEEFENWLAPKILATKAELASSNARVVQTIPIVFHILTDGAGSENLSQAQIQAQLDQLNIDYANLDNSPFASAADTEIQFCLAQQDPNGAAMNEPGINRITDYGDTGQTSATMDGGIKQATQWDPTKYLNIWVANLGGGLLGYAQFPDPAGTGIDGLDPADIGPVGAANTDGVVVVYSSVGSKANPNPDGGVYAAGRTLTHEVGHWIGLRHIWGDTGACSNDDYCADTPDATSSNFGCATVDSCPADGLGNDMSENYMDYSDDTCMNTFTNDQKTRILAVMANSPRRMELTSSIACQPATIYNLDGKVNIENLNVIDCATASLTPDIKITNAGNTVLTSATISYYLDSNTPTTFSWTGSLSIDQFEIISLPTINTTVGAHTFYAEISNPNNGTDENAANNTSSLSYTFTGGLCASVANTDYQTSTTGVIINDGTTDILSNLNTGKPSGYSDYTAIVTDVNRSESYTLAVNANSDGNYQIITYAWVDWNQNCSFDDAGEQYDLGQSADIANALTANSPLSFTVPADAALGNTIMRVTTKYTDPNANQFPTSCENGHDAEVEDYTINVLAPLSVDEFSLSGVSIYPNPTNNVINIKGLNTTLNSVEVYSITGQKVITATTNLETVNVSAIANGVYFLKLNTANATKTFKFIKE